MKVYPRIILDLGFELHFGQELAEVERLSGGTAVDHDTRITRPGIDKIMQLPNLSLSFDVDRLKGIKFQGGYGFEHDPAPFAGPWKNFPALGARRFHRGMTREACIAYLGAWESRSHALGAKGSSAEDLLEGQYRIAFYQDEYCDMISVNFGPTRKTSGGGRWGDGWTISFSIDSGRDQTGRPGLLKNVSAFCDEFNTVARTPKILRN